ncbi:MAG: hypothetical protein OEL53_08965 [Rhodospirillales bacterium]|nr:hypothetical protein [Rhodospirillales bacterium]
MFNLVNTKLSVDQLITERKSWETNEYNASKKRLYSILTNCLSIYYSIQCEVDAREQAELLAAAYNIVVQKNTPIASIVVKLIFGSENVNRVSIYSKVLAIAEKEKVDESDFAEWLEQNGGIESVRKNCTSSKVARETKREKIKTKQNAIRLQLRRVDPFATLDLDTKNIQGEYQLIFSRKNEQTGKLELLGMPQGVHKGLMQQVMNLLDKTLKDRGKLVAPIKGARCVVETDLNPTASNSNTKTKGKAA